MPQPANPASKDAGTSFVHTSVVDDDEVDLRRQPVRFCGNFGNAGLRRHPSTSEDLLVGVQDAPAEEIRFILDQGVVATVQDIDLCMLTGGGWPLHLGGGGESPRTSTGWAPLKE